MKETLHEKKRFIAQLLQETSDLDPTYLDIPCLQTIVQFKWNTYTKSYFVRRFMILGLFIIGLLADLYLCSNPLFENEFLQRITDFTARGLCGLVVLQQFKHEIF